MGFKQFLTEWIYNDSKQLQYYTQQLENINNYIKEKNFYKAELLMDEVWRILTAQIKIAINRKEQREIDLLKNWLNSLHKINKENKEIRNIATKEF